MVDKKDAKPVPVRPSLMDPNYKYRRVQDGVDVQQVWRRFGWVPPSEVKNVPSN